MPTEGAYLLKNCPVIPDRRTAGCFIRVNPTKAKLVDGAALHPKLRSRLGSEPGDL
jgi:hypothetical protein